MKKLTQLPVFQHQMMSQNRKLFASIAIAAVALLCVPSLGAQSTAPTTDPTTFYAAGVAYNHGATPAVAGNFLYAHAVSPDTAPGMYAFTAVDVLPASTKPFTVTTSIAAGIAQKVVTISGHNVYLPTSAGIALTGQNVGWAWSTGATSPFRIKQSSWYILPTVRVQKASVGGNGYTPIVGVDIAFGQ